MARYSEFYGGTRLITRRNYHTYGYEYEKKNSREFSFDECDEMQ